MREKPNRQNKAPLLQLRNATISEGEHIRFRRIDWTIREGERWALVGPSGSGKTTIAEVLAGLRHPARGEILYSFTADGAPAFGNIILISSESQMEARLSISPYYQARWNSAEEERSRTVRYFLSAQGIYGASEYHILSSVDVPAHFRESRNLAIKATGSEHLLRKRMMDLSNGELRKVLLARALSQRPRLLILDDPLSGLDAQSRNEFHKVVSAARQMDIGLLMLASSKEDLPKGCATHALLIRRNRIVFSGRANQAFGRSSRSPESACRVSCVPANGERGQVIVAMDGVQVKYGRTHVLRGVDWRIRQGEHWAVIGPNGSGKTTLLSLILGDNPQAYSNRIRIFGRARGSGESIWDLKKQIGHVAPEVQAFLPQDQTGLMAVISGFHDSIGLYRRCSGIQLREAARIMKKLSIGSLARRPLGEMSAAEQRIVLLARALVKRPCILVLDELCQGLDEPTKRRMLELLDRLTMGSDITLIVVTHRPEELPACITHVLFLDQGKAHWARYVRVKASANSRLM